MAVPLALLLLRASRWFDQQLLDRLEENGWPRLTPAQSLLFAQLPTEGISPAALARRLGTTRQSSHELLTGLVALDLLALVPDPDRRAGRLVQLTETGRALTRDAAGILAALEQSLGAHAAEILRGLLSELAPSERTDGGRV